MAIDTIVTNAIANDAVPNTKIPAGAVVADIADGSITNAKIATMVFLHQNFLVRYQHLMVVH